MKWDIEIQCSAPKIMDLNLFYFQSIFTPFRVSSPKALSCQWKQSDKIIFAVQPYNPF